MIRASQLADIVLREFAIVSALQPIELESSANSLLCIDKLNGNFTAAFVRPVMGAKANVPDGHRTYETPLTA